MIQNFKEKEDFWCSAEELLNHKRLDLTAKYAYVEHYTKKYDMSYVRELYAKHIEAFSGGNFCEPGNEQKNSLQAYYEMFDELIESLSEKGFDESISTIPISAGGVIGDGAHRTAIAMYNKKAVHCTQIEGTGEACYDYLFFRKQLLDEKYIEYMVTKYVELKKENVYVLCIWPSVAWDVEKLKIADEMIRDEMDVIYDKKLQLSYVGLRNLMIQAYSGFTWSGTANNHYKGVEGKVDPCYHKNEILQVYVLEGRENGRNIIELKARLRDLYQIENHSVHSSDNERETLELAHLLLNENSVHLLNYGKLDFDPDMVNRVTQFKENLLEKNQVLDNYIISSSSVLGLYGIRQAGDLDYLCMETLGTVEDVDNDNHYIGYYETSLSDLILNPDNYAYAFEMKFATLKKVCLFKKNRGTERDVWDVKLIENKLSETKSLVSNMQCFCIQKRRQLRNIKTKIRDFLQKNNIYVFTKIWHFLVGKGFR